MQGAALQHWFFNFEPDADRVQAMWSQIHGHSFAPFVGLMMGQPEIQNGPLTQAAASASQLQGVMPNPDLTTQGRGPIGAQWFINQPTRPYEFASPQHAMYAQTGEGGLKLWAGLRILHTAVVPNDPHFGLTAYGGTVEMNSNNEFVVVPQDGLRSRVTVVGSQFSIDLRTHSIEEVRIREDKTGVSFTVDNVSRMARTSEVTIAGLVPGRYDVIVNGEFQNDFHVFPTFDRNNLEIPFLFTYESPADATFELKIVPSSNLDGARRDLVSKLNAVSDLNQADYTAASWTRLMSAAAAARSILANPNATLAQVSASLRNITTMYGNLVQR
jgi:hypothetical protein